MTVFSEGETMTQEIFLYIRTTGWKSGNQHEIEIWFVEQGGCYYAVSERHEKAHWVQNVLHQPAVQMRLGREAAWQAAQARALDPGADAELVATIRALMEAKYKWSDGLIVAVCPSA
jgi:deazaflavin-dependent oxidoreductase (nitroreductase family)